MSSLVVSNRSAYCTVVDEEIANRMIDLQAEIAALRGAVRMLLHNSYNADSSALAVVREKAFQEVRLKPDGHEPGERVRALSRRCPRGGCQPPRSVPA